MHYLCTYDSTHLGQTHGFPLTGKSNWPSYIYFHKDEPPGKRIVLSNSLDKASDLCKFIGRTLKAVLLTA